MADICSILAIDDDPDLLSILKYSLEAIGQFTVKTALGGLHGCREAEAQTYDIIISDLIMPDIDGEMVIRRVRHSPKNSKTPIFLLTGNPDVGEALQIENVRVVSKPIDPYLLVSLIREAWNSKLTEGPED